MVGCARPHSAAARPLGHGRASGQAGPAAAGQGATIYFALLQSSAQLPLHAVNAGTKCNLTNAVCHKRIEPRSREPVSSLPLGAEWELSQSHLCGPKGGLKFHALESPDVHNPVYLLRDLMK